MRKSAVVFCAAAFWMAAFAFPEDWFAPDVPDGFWKGDIAEATVVGTTKEEGEVHIQLDQSGYSAKFEEIIEIYSKDKDTLYLAFVLQSMYEALQAQVMVFNMAESLDRLFSCTGIKITTDGGHVFTARFIGGTLRNTITGGQ